MFQVQQVSKPNQSGVRQIQIVDAEWDYNDDRLNWNRVMSFLPNWGKVWIRVDGNYIVISYGK